MLVLLLIHQKLANLSSASAEDNTYYLASSDPTVATISQDGTITPIGEGEVTIVAKAKDKFNYGEIEKPFAIIKFAVKYAIPTTTITPVPTPTPTIAPTTVPTPSSTPTPTSTPVVVAPAAPKTGDSLNLTLIGALLVISVLVITFIVKKKNK